MHLLPVPNLLIRMNLFFAQVQQVVGVSWQYEIKVGTHTLRKTFGYHHYQKFKDVAVLQKIFNHYSPQITMRYIGIDQDMIDDSYNNFVL